MTEKNYPEKQDKWTLLDHSQPIDYEKLDGRKVRMAHEDGRDLRGYKLERVPGLEPHDVSEWVLSKELEGDIQPDTLLHAWRGKGGWTLWLDGEIPMKKQTADQLEPGTEFYGIPPSGTKFKLLRTATGLLHLSDYQMAQISPSYFEVVEVLGMYGQKESE